MNSGVAAAGGAKAAPPKKPEGGRQFKSKLPVGKKGGGAPGLDGGADVVCPWEDFGDMEMSDLAQFGIV